MSGLGAVSLDGAKGVGKTETATRRATTLFALDDPDERSLLLANPTRLERAPAPVVVDEWQRLPEVWDRVRRSVDREQIPGRFLLTGSASPSPQVKIHSGAGRIVMLRMRPMILPERGVTSATVSLADLLTGDRPTIDGDTAITLSDYAEQIVASGFPGIRALPARLRQAQLEGYLERIVQRDFPEQGHLVRRPTALRDWLRAYAAATSTTASYTTILDAATAGAGDKPAKSTVLAYRDVLTQLWLLDPVPGWAPSRSPFAVLQRAPKHHLVDPALAARLLRATTESLLRASPTKPALPREGTLLGALFESLTALTLRVTAQAAGATVSHLRTDKGTHEVDFIVERDDRRVVAVEVKLTVAPDDDDVKHLRWLKTRLGDDLLDAVVVTTGKYAYRRQQDGIAVVPLALLGP